MKPAYSYFGGKSRVAPVIWQKFGNVSNYVEPFLGSAAVLLANPNAAKIETVNDINHWISNFFRAISADPEKVAEYAIFPVSEVDLHARHKFLASSSEEFRNKIENDPEYYDAQAAGYWVYGVSASVGNNFLATKGLNALPLLSSAGGGIHGITYDIPKEFYKLSQRLKRVRICSGDYKRILTPSVLWNNVGLSPKDMTGVFLDPPYNQDGRDKVYANDQDIFQDVVDWALKNGDNSKLRIAVCGYDGEYFPDTWEKYCWKADGGMSALSKNTDTRGKKNAKREVIWFNKACII